MSSSTSQESICPICSWKKRAPFTQAVIAEIIEHLKTHQTNPLLKQPKFSAGSKLKGSINK